MLHITKYKPTEKTQKKPNKTNKTVTRFPILKIHRCGWLLSQTLWSGKCHVYQGQSIWFFWNIFCSRNPDELFGYLGVHTWSVKNPYDWLCYLRQFRNRNRSKPCLVFLFRRAMFRGTLQIQVQDCGIIVYQKNEDWVFGWKIYSQHEHSTSAICQKHSYKSVRFSLTLWI